MTTGIAVGPVQMKSHRGERQLAAQQGKTRYFTGLPCKHGHIAERLTVNGSCCECSQNRLNNYRSENADLVRKRGRDLYAANREKRAAQSAAYRKKNPEAAKASVKKWCMTNRAKRTAAENERRASKNQATPTWLSEKHKQHIEVIYAFAKRLREMSGVDVAVDHMVPIKGKNVVGLHVPWNLCIIGRAENSAKNNKISELIKYPPTVGVMVAGKALPWNWNIGA